MLPVSHGQNVEDFDFVLPSTPKALPFLAVNFNRQTEPIPRPVEMPLYLIEAAGRAFSGRNRSGLFFVTVHWRSRFVR